MLRISSAAALCRASVAACARAAASRTVGAAVPSRSLKILAADPVDPICAEVFKDAGHKLVEKKLTREELLSVIGSYDGLVVRSGVRVTSDVIAAGRQLRVIGRAGAGVDNIDCTAATSRGILVMNTPGGNTSAAAELTLSLLMSLARRIPAAVASLKSGAWERKAFSDGVELKSKTIGIIGCGMIGVEVARRCMAMDMNAVGYDPTLTADRAAAVGIKSVSLDDLFKSSDFISIHTPLNESTRNVINAAALSRCKRGVFIINAARGGVVNEAHLLEALNSGIVAGAALDVFQVEPPTGVSKALCDHPRVVCTPHVGASTEEAQKKVAREIAVSMSEALAGSGYTGVVNAQHMPLAMRPQLQPYVRLSRALGSLHAQTWSGGFKSSRVHVQCEGPAFESSHTPHLLQLFKSSVLEGMLPSLPGVDLESSNLNLINASLLADQVGVHCTSSCSATPSPASSFANAIRVTVGGRVVVGAVVHGLPRVVQVDHWGSFPSFQPEGHVLMFNNLDQPGAVGRVTSILADHNINIASLSVARQYPGSPALSLIQCDSRIPSEVKGKVEALDGITNVRTASFGSEYVKPLDAAPL